MTVTTVAIIFTEDWLANFETHIKVLTDNSLLLTFNVLKEIWEKLDVKPLITREYHLQSNGQVQHSNDTISARPSQNFAEQEKYWYSYVVDVS